MTCEEAAEILTERGYPCTTRTVQRWCQTGLLPADRVGKGKGRTWRIFPHAIDKWARPVLDYE